MYILFFLLHFKGLTQISFLQKAKAAVPLLAQPCLIAEVTILQVVFSRSTRGLGSVKFS